MNFLPSIIAKAKAANRTVVLAEGQDPRVAKAAYQLAKDKVCKVIVIATPEEDEKARKEAGVSYDGLDIQVIDYTTSDLIPELANILYERRKAKGMTPEDATKTVQTKRLYFGNLLMKSGRANAFVAGSIASTGDMLRSAFHCVGTAKGVKRASSCFALDLKTPAPNGEDILLYADCAVMPNPSAEELVDVAHATAQTYRAVTDKRAHVAMLSYSTKGSAAGELVEKMQKATELTKQRFDEVALDADVDGELQADAALVPAVGAVKAPGSKVAGHANVLVFPDLQAGNISYKLTQRLSGATAYGPILQGLALPTSDLSRGCTAEDIYGVVAITICLGL